MCQNASEIYYITAKLHNYAQFVKYFPEKCRFLLLGEYSSRGSALINELDTTYFDVSGKK